MSFTTSLFQWWSGPATQASLQIVFDFLVATTLGAAIGYERAYHGRAAGMRTYAIVCGASAAVVSLNGHAAHWFGGHPDDHNVTLTHVIQGIVTGIGFLGAGVIMRDRFTISGLTTAASIWSASAIGILVGVRFWLAAAALAVLSTAGMIVVRKISGWLPSRIESVVTVHFRSADAAQEEALLAAMRAHDIQLVPNSLSVKVENDSLEWRGTVMTAERIELNAFQRLQQLLIERDDVSGFQIEPARH